MSVTCEFSGAYAKIEALKTNDTLGQRLAEEAMRGMDDYVPMRTGDLANTAVATPFEVEYPMPYAVHVYYGTHYIGQGNLKRDKHPLASLRWNEPYMTAHSNDLASAGTEIVRGL